MEPAGWWWSSAVIAFCTVTFGTVYWTHPYSDLDIGAIGLALYVAAVIPVAVLRATGVAPFVIAALTLPAGLVLAVLARIAVDAVADPTSHNLWPLEIVIAAVVGGFWGFVAAGLGEAGLRIRTR